MAKSRVFGDRMSGPEHLTRRGPPADLRRDIEAAFSEQETSCAGTTARRTSIEFTRTLYPGFYYYDLEADVPFIWSGTTWKVLRSGVSAITLSIDVAELQVLPDGTFHKTKTYVVPAGGRFFGATIGEGQGAHAFAAFSDGADHTWSVILDFEGPGTLSANVDGSTPMPLILANPPMMMDLSGVTVTLTVAIQSVSRPARVVGTTLSSGALYGSSGSLHNTTILGIASDTNPTPTSLTFDALSNDPQDLPSLLIKINTATGSDPLAEGSVGTAVSITSPTVGAASTLIIAGGTALPILGITPGTYHGADAASANTVLTGHVEGTVFVMY